MSFFNALIGMGATVMMPIIFFIVGLIFGVKPGKAFKAGMTVGIGFTGINMVVGLLLTSLGPAAMDMATRFGLKSWTWVGPRPQLLVGLRPSSPSSWWGRFC